MGKTDGIIFLPEECMKHNTFQGRIFLRSFRLAVLNRRAGIADLAAERRRSFFEHSPR